VSATALKRAKELAAQAAFLWSSRDFVARSSAVTFGALATIDDRISHLVGALGEKPGLAERFLEIDLSAFEAGRTFVTAAVALRSGDSGVVDDLVRRLEAREEMLAPLASALSWFDHDDVSEWMERLLGSSVPIVLRLGLMTAAAHRVDPGAPVELAMRAEDSPLRATALEAVGRLGAGDLRPHLRAALDDEDDACRFWAAWSAVRLGEHAGLPVLGRFAAAGGPFAKPACDIALRALQPSQAVAAQARLLSIASDKGLAVLAAGIVGDPALVEALLGWMETPSVARHAGAAFCLMTGRDLRRDDLDGPPQQVPAGEVIVDISSNARVGDQGPNGDSVTDVVLDDVDDLIWPEPSRIRDWWAGNLPAFVPGVRYLAGLPIGQLELRTVLRTGNQQQRAAAALELALLHPERPLLDVMAPSHRQVGGSVWKPSPGQSARHE